MKREKKLDDFSMNADIRSALHQRALTGGNKRYKTKNPIKFTDPVKEKIYLFDKMQKGKASNRELVYLSFLRGMITKEQYLDYLQIEKDCEESCEESCDED